jgi:hypothetical protein
MARLRPTSLEALLTVKGVGARKADDLGAIFLTAIRSHAQLAENAGPGLGALDNME